MNIKNFSLDYIQPSGATQTAPATDPWVEALSYYGPPILHMLQEGGHKTVQELFQKTQLDLKVPQLQLEQFVVVIDRLIVNKQVTVVKQGDSPGEAVVALAVPKT
jgi:hypothetical protein